MCYVKEQNKLGVFETSDLCTAEDLKILKVDIGIEDTNKGEKRVWIHIDFKDEGDLKATLFHGSEQKLRTWVESIKGSKWMYDYFIDSLKRWEWSNGH